MRTWSGRGEGARGRRSWSRRTWRFTVQLGPYKHPPHRPRWHIQHVTKWAEQQVAALTPEWLELHRAMYA